MPRPGLFVVNSSNSWGGNEFWSVRVARGMADRGHPVRFVWSHPVVGERVEEVGLDHCRVPLRNDLDLSSLLHLRREMARHGPDAVLLTRWREYLLGGVAARMTGVRRSVLGLGLNFLPPDDLKRRITFGLSDRILVNAEEIRKTLLEHSWISPEKVDVVVNGVDLDRFRPRWEPDRVDSGQRFRANHDIPATAPLVVNIGNLNDQKDHANLLDACALARAELPELRTVILGEGFLRPRLEEKRRALGLESSVLLPGFVEDILPALAAAHLFVLSSDNEGMAWVLMEAAASGLPIVTTDVSGARHCVLEGETGHIVPPRDAAALAAAMVGLLSDPARLERFGQRARRLAEQRFDVERMLDETAAVLFGSRAT